MERKRNPKWLYGVLALLAAAAVGYALYVRRAPEPTVPTDSNMPEQAPLVLDVPGQTAVSPATAVGLDMTAVKAAQAYRKGNQAVLPLSDATIVAEAEEFRIAAPAAGQSSGWRAMPWGANYYASTFAITFLSRKAYLSAPEQATAATATIRVQVPKAGRYLALVRYEAAPNFETQFKLRVEQNGQAKLDRLYGARDNLKIWAFNKKLQKEVSWDWGATENVVWEGHDAHVDLEAGPATLTLLAGKQPTPAARRNIDLVMLTSDEAQVGMRIEKEGDLPLDGMLTQAGDVYLKLHNSSSAPVTLTVPNGTEHSPYWVHLRDWKPKTLTAAPGQSTDWAEVGSLLDSINDGQWTLTAAGAPLRYDLEFGVRNADGKIETIRRMVNLSGNAELVYRGDMRYIPEIRTPAELLHEYVEYLKKQPVRGTAPQRTLVYGYTFEPKTGDAKYNAELEEFIRLIGATALNLSGGQDVPLTGSLARGYVDLRGQNAQQLETAIQKLKSEGKADKIAVVSLGDEITLTAPSATDQSGFHGWLQQRGLSASDVDPAAGSDWNKVTYNAGKEIASAKPSLFYYSTLYSYHYGIQTQKALTDVLRRNLPNAGIGANYSPHHGAPYLGTVHQWVTMFREGGMTMPWSEDYVWQIPIGSQQMNFIGIDLFRAAIRHQPDAKIHMYVMPHWPGNTPDSWRRQFYGAIGHGTKILNLFEFRPVQAAYTENHVSLPAMYQEVRRGLHELGQFEDIVQDGQVRPGVAALWFSETGDIWDNNRHPFAAAKRTLYVAIRHQQLPLDFVVEQDALAGDLKNYRVLYLTDQNVSRAASKAITDWVNAGGRLFATAGGGMLDEFNAPNQIMRQLLGVEPQTLQESDGPIRWAKQDLPFAKPLDTVSLKTTKGKATLPVFGVRSRFTLKGATAQATFADGSPALSSKKAGAGIATYCGFLPGLCYFKPALPLRPVDRGSTDDSMAHFIPTKFDRAASALIGSPASGVERPVVSSVPLVESTIIQARQGVVIPLTNWSGGPVKKLKLSLNITAPTGSAKLASGQPVKVSRQGAKQVFTFDLDVADALILR
ncbi:MAG TPA: beta-galactosidase trimerization domain-containing protein [Abditibacteriaceae bacterium]|nr:beta-galactosidase trimerization domain-containing protein [Abditibacteriaceae bacterium]